MTSFAELLQQGASNAWFFIPSAILLGALHGLEPGHSKTMMAAFIVAVRGTVSQAVLLGLAATVSHTAVVWGVALAGLYLFQGVEAGASEPYFQLVSAAIIIAIAAWMFGQTWRERHRHAHHHDAHHGHAHHHAHDHAGHHHDHGDHDHHHAPVEHSTHDALDAHARSHAEEIGRRFSGRPVTTWQIVLFGLTGGLIPCPAAITVLLLCIQLKAFSLGAALVLCFSIGLALTLVAVGVVAAIGVRQATSRMSWLGEVAGRAPYASSLLIVLVGLYTGYQGWTTLRHGHSHAAPAAPTQMMPKAG
jgi:nickel/cobalt exporter